MGWSGIWMVICAVLGAVGWVLAFLYRRRAIRYRAAFDRAFAIARRAYNFTADETGELNKIIGEPIERRPSGTGDG